MLFMDIHESLPEGATAADVAGYRENVRVAAVGMQHRSVNSRRIAGRQHYGTGPVAE